MVIWLKGASRIEGVIDLLKNRAEVLFAIKLNMF